MTLIIKKLHLTFKNVFQLPENISNFSNLEILYLKDFGQRIEN